MDLLKCISSVLGHSYAGRRFIGCKNMINATFYTFNCQLPTGCTIRVKVYASDLWQLSHPLFFMHSSNTEVQYEDRRRVDHFFKNKKYCPCLFIFVHATSSSTKTYFSIWSLICCIRSQGRVVSAIPFRATWPGFNPISFFPVKGSWEKLGNCWSKYWLMAAYSGNYLWNSRL